MKLYFASCMHGGAFDQSGSMVTTMRRCIKSLLALLTISVACSSRGFATTPPPVLRDLDALQLECSVKVEDSQSDESYKNYLCDRLKRSAAYWTQNTRLEGRVFSTTIKDFSELNKTSKNFLYVLCELIILDKAFLENAGLKRAAIIRFVFRKNSPGSAIETQPPADRIHAIHLPAWPDGIYTGDFQSKLHEFISRDGFALLPSIYPK